MSGALLQLVATGTQNVHFNVEPEVTFWRIVYKRYSNFAMESIQQNIIGTCDFGKNFSVQIARSGDLISKVYLEVELPEMITKSPITDVGATIEKASSDQDEEYLKFSNNTEVKKQCGGAWIKGIGNHLIRSVTFKIGGTPIDTHYGEFMQIWSELTYSSDKQETYNKMIGNIPQLYDPFWNEENKDGSIGYGEVLDYRHGIKKTGITSGPYVNHDKSIDHAEVFYYRQRTIPAYKVRVPLQFSFCKHPGLALPLVALQYHTVELKFDIENIDRLFVSKDFSTGIINSTSAKSLLSNSVETPMLKGANCWIDYAFLENEEREIFATEEHEYMIEQLQYNGEDTISKSHISNLRLMFNHPTKELIWGIQGEGKALGEFDFNGENPVVTTGLKLNGLDRFEARDGGFYNLTQPFHVHTNKPPIGINLYSFSLTPETPQPSGTINFSRIDDAYLHITNSYSSTNDVKTKQKYSDYHMMIDKANGIEKSIIDIKISNGYNINSSTGLQNMNSFYSPARIKIFAINYNILKIQAGMGGIKFSN